MTPLDMEIAAYLAITILQHGADLAFSLYERWNKQDPTRQDLTLLKSLPINPDTEIDPLGKV
jgi:hypothetical protein